MGECKKSNKLNVPCSEGFTDTLEDSVKRLDNNKIGIRFKKINRR